MKRGDWVIEVKTNRMGTVRNISSGYVTVSFGKYAVAVLTPLDLKPAPLDIQQEDYQEMIELALQMKDKEWFMDLTNRFGGLKNAN